MSFIEYFKLMKKKAYEAEKDHDAEDYVDRYFYDPFGFMWAELFIKLNVHPNVVTMISLVAGVCGALLTRYSSIWASLGAIILIIWSVTLDATDGQVARTTGKTSELGRFLDGIGTIAWYLVVYIILLGKLGARFGVFGIILVFVSAILGNQLQCCLADYFRNQQLFFKTNGVKRYDIGRSADITAEIKQAEEEHKSIKKLYLVPYFYYTRVQEKFTPKMRELLAWAEGTDPGEWGEVQTYFIEESKKIVMFANFFTINPRTIALFISLLVGEPLVFIAVDLVVLGLLMLYTRARYEKIATKALSMTKK